MSIFACSSNKNSKRIKRSITTNNDLLVYKEKYRFTDNELIEFRQRFNYSAGARGLIDQAAFMESMGVLGLEGESFLSSRIFHLMDKDKDGYIGLDEYLNYFDVLIYGSQEQKDELTFRIIDIQGNGFFNFNQFSEMILSMMQAWSNITGYNNNIHQNKKLAHFLQTVFNKFDIEGVNKVTLQSFKTAVAREPELLEIFDYFNEGIIDAVQPHSEFDQQQNEMIQEMEQLQEKLENLKAVIYNKETRRSYGATLQIENTKDLTPPVNYRRGSIFTANKLMQEENKSEILQGEDDRRASVFQSLDSKIRKTALFEHLKECTIDDGKPEGIETHPNESYRNAGDGLDSGRKPHLSKLDIKSAVPGSKDNSQPNSAIKILNPFNVNDSGRIDTNEDASDRGHNRKATAGFGKIKNTIGVHNTILSSPDHIKSHSGRKQNEIPDQEQKSIKVNKVPILEENLRRSLDDNQNLQSGVKYTKKTITEVEDDAKEEDIIHLDDIEAYFGNDIYIENKNAFGVQKPDTERVRPKVLDIDEIGPYHVERNKAKIEIQPPTILDDVKSSDSLTNQSKRSLQYQGSLHYVEERKEPKFFIAKKAMDGVSGKANNDDFKYTYGENDKEKMSQIQVHVEGLIAETQRILEELHRKKRLGHKIDQQEEDKKMEMLKEQTAINIPKPSAREREKKERKSNFVSFGHQNWNLVVNMMLGIQMAVKSAVERREAISFKDFKLKYIFELVPKRTNEMKGAYKICKFFDYAPSVFMEIRKLFGIRNEDYLKSIGPESMLNGLIKGNLSTLAELTSSGKSGSFFYFSADGKYTLKTISRDEFHFMRKILNNYYNHLMNNPNTMIIRFFGLHKIRFMKGPERKTKLYFVIMSNVFHTAKEIHIRYDLKGSTQGRITRDIDPSIARKDLNIIQDKEKIVMSKDCADTFIKVLEKDAQFFHENRIIDYSLLLGIHHLEPEEINGKDTLHKRPTVEFKPQSRDGILSGDGTKIYFLGVIDILTEFNAKKRAEYMIKRVTYGKGISAIPPPQYAARFLKFIKGLVVSK